MPSESQIIARLRERVAINDNVLLGIGDDAAVLKVPCEHDLIACCDLMVEDVHFRAEWTPALLLGRKSLAVNLSDVAAMGAVPKFAMISIALPDWCSADFVDELFEGIYELANASGVSVIGGDTSSSPDSLFIDISVIGECERGKAITRRGANVGDSIYVSGSLGASALGLSFLEGGFRLSESQQLNDPRRQAVLKHLSPEPQLALGRAIGEAGLATAMIDISDGLSTDLWHILDESGVGAVIYDAAIPIAECVRSVSADQPGIDPLSLALNGGEEYELLFTVHSENRERVVALAETLGVTLTLIGEITAEKRLNLERAGGIESLPASGYEHMI
ncbi:MAG TPA: thiamine-phosphate kinase [Blastocatellia bacterium]|nr:thiamine-phosphate kinase [Blastocatellia bacterium]